ncbi:putative methyltransferase DDB_G0268948 [Lissotriton helveticus]
MLPVLQYADDSAIMDHTKIGLQRPLTALNSFNTANSLTVFKGKTKVIIFGSYHQKRQAQWQLGNAQIHSVTSYNYLGVWFSERAKANIHLNQLASKANKQMPFRFERKEHSKLYEKFMIREPEALLRMILSYLEEKKGKPFGMAVDVGCGTGQSTRILAPYFEKVVGVDISKSQIQEAENVISPINVSYMIAKAEELPFEDRSLDLVTASVAAHWFDLDKFSEEVNRVLKPSGCLAIYCFDLRFSLLYKDCSERLTDVFNEAIYFLSNEYENERCAIMYSRYKKIFDALPFEDKTRVTDILHKRQISIAALKGFVESLCLYQSYFLADPEAAQEFLQKLQGSLLENMGESSTDTELELCNSYVCILACPSTK